MKKTVLLALALMAVGCAPEPRAEPRDVETLQVVDGVYLNPENGEPYSGSVSGLDSLSLVCGFRFYGTLRNGKFHGSYSLRSTPEIGHCLASVQPESGEYRNGEKCGRWSEYERSPSGEVLLTPLSDFWVTYPPCPPDPAVGN